MLISSSVNMNITNRNKAYYINKGYRIDKINQVIEIQVTDLPKRSNAIVNVQCDYCFQIKKVKYSRFQILNPDGIRSDACKNCFNLKQAVILSQRIENDELNPKERGYWMVKENIKREIQLYISNNSKIGRSKKNKNHNL